MSGDVQPRKRKDKKRKKDDLGVEEPRGTAAALGDGDLFIHSHHEHGTGGHWCAKIIFFSLLAILITLIGLIILENRGLSELEANSVESRYSGVLEGWLEDAPDDDHHDVHTLELKHHDHDDEEEEQNGSEADDGEDIGQDEDNSEEIDHDEDNSEEIDHEDDEDDASQQIEEDNEDEDEHDEHGDDDDEDDDHASEEVEKIEHEVSDEDPISTELPALPEEDDSDDDSDNDKNDDGDDQSDNEANQSEGDVGSDNDDEFLEQIDDDDDGPPVEKITAPSGQPFDEIEEFSSKEKPPNTLDEEDEYEKQQEELRREEEEKSSQKDGGNSMEDYWPSEPSDPHWHEKLEEAERDLLQGRLEAALMTAKAAELQASARARWVIAQALDKMAEAKRDNKLLTQAIAAYLEVLKMKQNMSDKKLLQVTERALNRIQFRGTYLSAEPVYRLLIRRFPNDVRYRNNLTITFLMAGRSDLAEGVLKETLKIWPNERVALAHYAFVLKTEHNRYEEAVELFQKALEGDVGPACEPRFYYHYGDALLLLGRFSEAHEVHKRGAAHGHFLSPEQRSLYNVERLKSRPWWDVEKQTPYANLARALEKSWRDILKEGEAAKSLYEQEKEGLRERGEWSQLDLFVRGQEIPGRCKTAPVTCSIVRSETAAIGCRRGQIKFSSMEAGTHVRPHVGPTNCRLRMHLGLKNTKDSYIRVHKETRQWREGKVLLFDDSFEHEVWHNGTGTRLVLIVDVWHPDLTAAERRRLPAI